MQKSQNEAVCEGLRAHIRELWDRLQIPAEERQAVALVATGSKAKVRKAVRNQRAGPAVPMSTLVSGLMSLPASSLSRPIFKISIRKRWQ